MKKIDAREEKSWCFKIVFLLILILGFSYMHALDIENIKNGVGIWGETWECKNCGYENYSNIKYCPICGSQKK